MAVAEEVVSAVLLTDRKRRQCLVQLRRYFEAHPVKVITDQPIKHILSKTETSGKLAKYVVELGAYNITFVPRNAVKAQVLTDFLSEAPKEEKAYSYLWMPKSCYGPNAPRGKRSISSVPNVEDEEPPLDFPHLKIPKMDVLGDVFGEQSLD
nr:reverse transcriptase domain-containing protein [Tanacetum cinerariifolium]